MAGPAQRRLMAGPGPIGCGPGRAHGPTPQRPPSGANAAPCATPRNQGHPAVRWRWQPRHRQSCYQWSDRPCAPSPAASSGGPGARPTTANDAPCPARAPSATAPFGVPASSAQNNGLASCIHGGLSGCPPATADPRGKASWQPRRRDLDGPCQASAHRCEMGAFTLEGHQKFLLPTFIYS